MLKNLLRPKKKFEFLGSVNRACDRCREEKKVNSIMDRKGKVLKYCDDCLDELEIIVIR